MLGHPLGALTTRDKEDAELLLCPRMFSAPKDGKLLKRWNEFIPRKGTLKPSSKELKTKHQKLHTLSLMVILPKVVFRYALRGSIGKMMTNPGTQRP
ncbi:hypothetical protein OUZ56_023769 [Daphnia magna]|uniref:Uncharacterized protein n=1 Tax=Daphnia magna TaxID=35525 RepID=A0ABR0AZI8_9CRUS|nr:hypothetical protein OUZ56_023769 [Daphnia magna]